MEDREEKTASEPDIEAHRRKKGLKATDEPEAAADEGQESESDVELHRKTKLSK